MAGWEQLQETVRLELLQRMEEGCQAGSLTDKLAAAGSDEMKLMEVYRELMELKVAEDFPYREPSGLAEIRSLRPDGPRKLDARWSPAEWRDKFYGAWLGRSVGCALGKPLEYWDYLYGKDGRAGRILSCGSKVQTRGRLPAIPRSIHGRRRNTVWA